MERDEMLNKLDRIVDSITAKGHPMQDSSTIKMAILELIEVMKKMIEDS